MEKENINEKNGLERENAAPIILELSPSGVRIAEGEKTEAEAKETKLETAKTEPKEAEPKSENEPSSSSEEGEKIIIDVNPEPRKSEEDDGRTVINITAEELMRKLSGKDREEDSLVIKTRPYFLYFDTPKSYPAPNGKSPAQSEIRSGAFAESGGGSVPRDKRLETEREELDKTKLRYYEELRRLEEERRLYSNGILELQAQREALLQGIRETESFGLPTVRADKGLQERELEDKLLADYEMYCETNLDKLDTGREYLGGSYYVPFDDDAHAYNAENYERASEDAKERQLLREYEASLSEKEKDRILPENLDEEYHSLKEYRSDDLERFAKAELLKRLKKYHKDDAELSEKIRKIEKKQRYATEEEAIKLIVDKIALAKDLTEMSIEALSSCVYAGSRFKISRYKKFLDDRIVRYNSYCEEYETLTGRPLTRLSSEISRDVIDGRISEPIPNVYYTGDSAFGAEAVEYSETKIAALREARLREEAALAESEMSRVLADGERRILTERERRLFDKKYASRISAIKRASERDILLVGLRNEYRLSILENERDILANSFKLDQSRKNKELRLLDHRISKMNSFARREAKLEKDDNARYYMLSLYMPGEEKIRKNARRERLDALKMRLEVLLSERERLNESLIALYGGTDKKLNEAKIKRRARNVRKKHARAMYRRQRDDADRISAFKAPVDIKEKALGLLNKKTLHVAKIEENIYKLRKLKQKGRARRELVLDIKRSKSIIRQADSDLKFIMRRMRKYNQRYLDDRNWGILLGAVGIMLLLALGVYYFFGDELYRFFQDWFFGGK